MKQIFALIIITFFVFTAEAQFKLTIIYGLFTVTDTLTYDSNQFRPQTDSKTFYMEYTVNDSIDFTEPIGWIKNIDLAKQKAKRKKIILGKKMGTHRAPIIIKHKSDLKEDIFIGKIKLTGFWTHW